ncbi:hypothetical protein DTO027B5_1874 [Paecilomyces variotii]|nr:hypothetical protein DTO169C6_1030 [Paecilomyces variotii]KAJ9327486.1 hypothetical protein DTO027B3_1708 [Paecilomyces variotii]KAJ9336193.1 hypothetical protein DTO027B5_1874 [Paecilomyces variotii]KAJ9406397.1 hypothetical protein DTO045G8_5786 [Paecilomyces variotii]
MSGRVIKEMVHGSKKIPIILAEEVQDRGFKRVIDAIDPTIVQQTGDRVEDAFKGVKMMTPAQKARTEKIVITSMPHSDSPNDPEDHSTVYAKDSAGHNVCVGHVTTDQNKQQITPQGLQTFPPPRTSLIREDFGDI